MGKLCEECLSITQAVIGIMVAILLLINLNQNFSQLDVVYVNCLVRDGTCGDGIVYSVCEECDDANDKYNDGCSPECLFDE